MSVLAGVCLARFGPFAEDTRFAVAIVATIPLWVVAACTLAIVAGARRTWLLALAGTLLLAVVVVRF